jgi:hypothetical protein
VVDYTALILRSDLLHRTAHFLLYTRIPSVYGGIRSSASGFGVSKANAFSNTAAEEIAGNEEIQRLKQRPK